MQISQLVSAISSGLTRTNRWQVQFTFPQYAGTSQDGQQAALLARSAATPASQIGVINVSWGGRELPVPGDRTYEQFDVTFISVNDMNVYNAFQSWSETINGSSSNTGVGNLIQAYADITLNLLDTSDNVTKSWTLHDAWPTVVGSINLDAGEMDNFGTFSVTLRYTSYTQPNITQ